MLLYFGLIFASASIIYFVGIVQNRRTKYYTPFGDLQDDILIIII